MTDLRRLKEAVAMYRKGDWRDTDAYTIAEAVTDETPISVEALKGMGFVAGATVGMLFFDGIGANRLLAFLFDDGIRITLDGKNLRPQPRTVGQLLFLLLSLEKESS